MSRFQVFPALAQGGAPVARRIPPRAAGGGCGFIGVSVVFLWCQGAAVKRAWCVPV